MTDRRKQSIYLDNDTLDQLDAEAERLDRSLSWIMQHAWEIARSEIALIPSHADLTTRTREGTYGHPE